MTDLDIEVRTYLDLSEKIERLTAERDAIKARLRDLGPGQHGTSYGINVTVSFPPRSFNLNRAWTMLTPEQQAACVAPDAKKVKANLSEVLIDACMDDGTGEPRVSIK